MSTMLHIKLYISDHVGLSENMIPPNFMVFPIIFPIILLTYPYIDGKKTCSDTTNRLFFQGLESVPQAEAATEREAEISDLKQWNCQHSFPPGHWEPVFFFKKKKQVGPRSQPRYSKT